MKPRFWLRGGFFVTVALVFAGALLGILLTGPVVVRVPRIDVGVEPSPERLRGSVQTLCTEFTPRSYRDVGNLDRAADWIAGRLRDAGLDVELQEYRIEAGRMLRRRGSRPTWNRFYLRRCGPRRNRAASPNVAVVFH